ncbi:hypothetical protein JHK85_007146 [Glycine max]|nr:hypothetical protein JHK85_007146 [Glycine max]KAG5071742.1 hypothetical protein JHK86_006953 [Glycine max]
MKDMHAMWRKNARRLKEEVVTIWHLVHSFGARNSILTLLLLTGSETILFGVGSLGIINVVPVCGDHSQLSSMWLCKATNTWEAWWYCRAMLCVKYDNGYDLECSQSRVRVVIGKRILVRVSLLCVDERRTDASFPRKTRWTIVPDPTLFEKLHVTQCRGAHKRVQGMEIWNMLPKLKKYAVSSGAIAVPKQQQRRHTKVRRKMRWAKVYPRLDLNPNLSPGSLLDELSKKASTYCLKWCPQRSFHLWLLFQHELYPEEL